MNRWLLGVFLFLLPLSSMAGANPFLLTLLLHASGPSHPTGYIPVNIDEQVAARATVPGGSLWVTLPSGAVRLIYSKSIIHKDGTWTWIGVLSDAPDAPKAVITFGDHAVFGVVPAPSGKVWSLLTLRGKSWLIDSRFSPSGVTRPSVPSMPAIHVSDAMHIPARVASNVVTPPEATASNPATVDLLVVYTQGFLDVFGSTGAAIARINYVVDLTNQAFNDSGVYGRIRLVHTAEVPYPDSSGATTLDDLLGTGPNGVPASLASVAPMRKKYGADAVTLMQVMNDQTVLCASTVSMGHNLSPITPADAANAYSFIDDDGNWNCGSIPGYGLAEELGSNFGLVPDISWDPNNDGAYLFSHAYTAQVQAPPPNGTGTGYTLLGQQDLSASPFAYVVRWPYFSNPNINLCNSGPCGIAGQSDAAQSLNLTLPMIATFSPTKDAPINDANGDGNTDLIWQSNSGGQDGGGQLAYWIMDGPQLVSSQAFPQYAGRSPIATGDFNGDGYMDAIWSDGTSMWMWVGDGSSFANVYMRPRPVGWTLAGTADLDGDGNADLIWTNGNQIAEWLMDGVGFRASYRQTLATGWRYIGAGDFDGDGQADLLLTNGTAMEMWTHFFDGAFASAATHAYPAGWTLLDTGDVDGDGMSDLLWRDNSRTHFAYWTMSGPQLVKSWSVAVTPEWTMGTSGDFNGDGLLDLIWYNGSQIVMWPGNSNGAYKGVVIHSYPTGGWTMLQ